MRSLNPDREQILYLLLIFRVIDRKLLVSGELSPAGNYRMSDAIHYLIKAGYVDEVENPPFSYLFLNRKGYDYLTENVGRGTNQYAYLKSRRKQTSQVPHFYLNIIWVWNYLENNWDEIKKSKIAIYPDQDINNCKLEFHHGRGEHEIRPDLLIFKYDENNEIDREIIVENDRSTENSIQIFNKYLRYFAYFESEHPIRVVKTTETGDKNIDIYFSSNSQRRIENLFREKYLSKHFKHSNRFGTNLVIRAKDIIRLNKSEYLNLYASSFPDLDHQEVDFEDIIRKNKLLAKI